MDVGGLLLLVARSLLLHVRSGGLRHRELLLLLLVQLLVLTVNMGHS